MASIYDIIASGGNAALAGAQQGVLDLGSTVNKNGANFQVGPSIYDMLNKLPNSQAVASNPFMSTMQSGPTAQQVQQDYLNKLQQYQNNPNVQTHPLLAGAGRVGAQSAMTAPLFVAAGSSGAGLATAGILSAGMMNSPSQGENLFNTKNALYSAPIAAAGGLIQSAMPLATNATEELAPILAKKAGMAVEDISPMITGSVDNTTGMVNLNNLANNVSEVAPESKASSLLTTLSGLLGPYAQHFIPGAQTLSAGGVGSMLGGMVGGSTGALAGGIIGAASPKVLNTIFNNGSLTSLLKMVSDSGDTLFSNPSVTALLMNRLNAGLTSAGINAFINHENGNIELRHNTSDIENKATPIDHINPQAIPQKPTSSITQNQINMKNNATAPQALSSMKVDYSKFDPNLSAMIYGNNYQQLPSSNDPTSKYSLFNGIKDG